MNPLFSEARRHSFSIAVGVLVLILVFGYLAGYRPGPGLTLARVGTLSLGTLPSGSTLYVDQVAKKVAKSGPTTLELIPGSHMVIVNTPGDYPWNEVVSITSAKMTNAAPFFVPFTLSHETVSGEKLPAAIASIASSTVPTTRTALRLGCTELYVEQNQLIARQASGTGTVPLTCTPPSFMCVTGTCAPTLVFSPTEAIHGVIPFPGRTDAVIVSYGSTISAIELDPREPQFFAPLLRGSVALTIAPVSDTSFLAHASKSYVVFTLATPTTTDATSTKK